MVDRPFDVRARAFLSEGRSSNAIHQMVLDSLPEQNESGLVLDVGCGDGALARWLSPRFGRYVGADVVRHPGYPETHDFVTVDLDRAHLPLPDSSADVVTCVETIEHVENPRALVRELARLVKPGGWVLVTTPNQLSLTSKLCLLFRNEFLHFQERPGLYPAHITALLEIDLRRIATEAGLDSVEVSYSGHGRVPFSARLWPTFASQRWRRPLSDNLLLRGRRPPLH